MPQPPKSIGARIALAGIVILALVGVVGWRLMQPKIKTTTIEEIRAVLPQELLVETSPDIAAQQRYVNLVDVVKKLDSKEINAFTGSAKSMTAAQGYELANAFWKTHPHLCEDIDAVLAAGPLQFAKIQSKATDIGGFASLNGIRQLIKAASVGGRLYASHGQFEQSTKLYLTALRLADALTNDGGPLINYLIVIASPDNVTVSLAQALANPKFPVADCKRILEVYPAAQTADEVLASGIRTDFQQFALKLLPDPLKDLRANVAPTPRSDDDDPSEDNPNHEPISGTYDPVQTAKLLGQLVAESMSNARLPMSKANRTIESRVEADAKSLPAEVDQEMPDGMGKSWA